MDAEGPLRLRQDALNREEASRMGRHNPRDEYCDQVADLISWRDELLAQATRLEGQNAAKDAALRRMMAGFSHGGAKTDCSCGACIEARAALKDTGEGWLPLEVREQVEKALEELMAGSLHGGPKIRCVCPACIHGRAALDALRRE